MCGIVGLLVKKPELVPELGGMITPMFECMAERGPDSGGVAVFGDALPASARKISLYATVTGFDWPAFESAYVHALGQPLGFDVRGNHALLCTSAAPEAVRSFIGSKNFSLRVLSVGQRIEVFKDQGNPRAIARAYGFEGLAGSHAIGHTRMATESRVSPAHAHPFTAGQDFCLVHNGSLSNPYMLRRKLEACGLTFETDNDSEAACRYLEWRMSSGESLDGALEHAFRELDGFYTFLIGTSDSLTVVRDPVACKPAVVAETDAYVAVASEFRSLSHLPGIERARVFEPLPRRVYTWSIH